MGALPMKSSRAKAMKAMGAKCVTKIAKGRLAKALVLRGSKEKTTGGLTQNMLQKNKRGKIVSKKASAHGKRQYKNIEAWVESVVTAREALRVNGFVAVNGKTLQGKALYVKSKALYSAKNAVMETTTETLSAKPAVME